MAEIEQYRSRYKYGTPEARIYRDMAIPESTWDVVTLDIALSFLLFGAHRTYRTRLQSTSPNGYIYLPEFRSLMQSLLAEWAGEFCCIRESTLYSH